LLRSTSPGSIPFKLKKQERVRMTSKLKHFGSVVQVCFDEVSQSLYVTQQPCTRDNCCLPLFVLKHIFRANPYLLYPSFLVLYDPKDGANLLSIAISPGRAFTAYRSVFDDSSDAFDSDGERCTGIACLLNFGASHSHYMSKSPTH